MRSNPAKIRDVPSEIIVEILLLLPFKSILACRDVSKQWRNLINHPNFLNHYRDRPLGLFVKEGNLYCVLAKHGSKNTITVNGFGHPIFTVRRIPIEPNHYLIESSVTMASNGITGVKTQNGQFLFYNLFSGARYTVKDAPLGQLSSLNWLCYGFGYDIIEDDYKMMVVCDYMYVFDFFSFHSNPIQNKDNGLFWIYSFRKHCWKPLRGFPYNAYYWRRMLFDMKRQACSFNGVLHWIVEPKENQNKIMIVTYDLHTCRFGEILGPAGSYGFDCLTELGGQLCCCLSAVEHHVWAMKEYGVEESWTMLFRVDFIHSVHPTALCELEDGNGNKVVFFVSYTSGSFYWYNLGTNEVTLIR